MKIVFLQDDFPPQSFGGAGFSVYELAKGMLNAGHDVSVITTCRRASEAEVSEYEGLVVYRIATDYPGRWRSYVSINNRRVVRKVESILRELKPDVVHANNIHAYLSYASLKAAKRYAKVVWTARDAMAFSYGKLETRRYLQTLDASLTWRDTLRQAGRRWNPLRNFFIRRYLRYADARFSVSEALARALEQNGIGDVTPIHTGVSPEAWQVEEEQVRAFKKNYGLEAKKVILFGGRLNAVFSALQAMKILTQKLPDAVLVIMGKTENAPFIHNESKGLDVVCVGWLSGEEKIAAYCASDTVWVPSTYFDAFPRSALEGMAAGKPIVASCYGGAPEAVKDGETGYIVDPRRPEEIAKKTEELLRNSERAARMGEAGQERIRKDFSLERMISSYLEHYRGIIDKTP